jgi:hypothetical protein
MYGFGEGGICHDKSWNIGIRYSQPYIMPDELTATGKKG